MRYVAEAHVRSDEGLAVRAYPGDVLHRDDGHCGIELRQDVSHTTPTCLANVR